MNILMQVRSVVGRCVRVGGEQLLFPARNARVHYLRAVVLLTVYGA